jgi:hypothetical protein
MGGGGEDLVTELLFLRLLLYMNNIKNEIWNCNILASEIIVSYFI